MNEHTLRKLKNNPHYKLNAKQQREADKAEKMIEFGVPSVHNGTFKTHKGLKKRRTKNEA